MFSHKFLYMFSLASVLFGQATTNGDYRFAGGVTANGGFNAGGVETGTVNAYAFPVTPGALSYVVNACYTFKAANANTGAATVNIGGLGVKAMKKAAGGVATDLAANDIRAGQTVTICYDGTNFQVQSVLGNASSGGGGQSALMGAFAAIAATPCNSANSGQVAKLTDSLGWDAVCDGAAWQYFLDGKKITLPVTSGFSLSNVSGTGAISTTSGGILLTAATGTTAKFMKPAPVAPWAATVAFRCATGSANCGVAFQNAANATLWWTTGTQGYSGVVATPRYGGPDLTGYGGDDRNQAFQVGVGVTWVCLEDNGTNTAFYTSASGLSWQKTSQRTRNDPFGGGGPTKYGFMLATDANVTGEMSILHFKEGTTCGL